MSDSRTDPSGEKKRKMQKHANMHDGIAVWCDCCLCEAEPYWAAVAEELGIDLGDYEDDGNDSPGASSGEVLDELYRFGTNKV